MEILLKVVVILNMLLKLNFFLRIFNKFGLLVNLVSTCFKDIIPFVNYLMIWLLSFVMLYIQTGIIPPPRQGLNGDFWGSMIFVIQNSIGNINDPEPESFGDDTTPFQTFLIYTVWIMN